MTQWLNKIINTNSLFKNQKKFSWIIAILFFIKNPNYLEVKFQDIFLLKKNLFTTFLLLLINLDHVRAVRLAKVSKIDFFLYSIEFV
jgi:hypothetical protein